MNTTGKRWRLSLVFWTMVTTLLALWFVRPASISSQNTGSLEADCVALASASTSIVPASLTPQEFCKVVVALIGNEWLKAAKLEATADVVDVLSARMVVVDTTIVQLAGDIGALRTDVTQLQIDIAALQAQGAVQPQIDAINAKLANMAEALQ